MRMKRAAVLSLASAALVTSSLISTSALGLDAEATSASAAAPVAQAAAKTAAQPAAEVQSGEKVLGYRWEPQNLAYNCGPFAMRIALSAFGQDVSADELAAQAGTTEAGTNFGEIERVMNARLNSTFYETKWISEVPTQEQKDLFWHDVQFDIDRGHPVIVDIMTGPDASPDFYPKNQGTIYHFFTVVGYNADNRQVKVADPANFGGVGEYWIPADQVALMAGGRGYTG